MPLNIQWPKPTDMPGELRGAANFLQQLQRQHLANRLLQTQAQFAPQQQQAQLNKLAQAMELAKAQEGLTRQRTALLPQTTEQAGERLGLTQRRLELEEKKFAPEQLEARRLQRLASVGKLRRQGITPLGKSLQEQENILKGLTPGGETRIEPLTQEETERTLDLYDQDITNRTTDPFLRQSLIQAESIDKTLESIPFERIAKFYGIKGRALAAAEATNVAAGQTPSPDYQAYLNFLKVKGPGVLGQMRLFLKDSVTTGAQDKLRKLIFPDKWKDNPQTALSQFNALMALYRIEKTARRRGVTDPTILTGLKRRWLSRSKKASAKQLPAVGEPRVGGAYQAPTFNSEQEYDAWITGATPAQKEKYHAYVRGLK